MAPPVPALPIQAAFRGHQDRTKLKARAAWMGDLSQGESLTPRTLGDVNGEVASRPRALLGRRGKCSRRPSRRDAP